MKLSFCFSEAWTPTWALHGLTVRYQRMCEGALRLAALTLPVDLGPGFSVSLYPPSSLGRREMKYRSFQLPACGPG